MRLNIFRVDSDDWKALERNLNHRGMASTQTVAQGAWKGDFLFCSDPEPTIIPWVKVFAEFIGGDDFHNKNYFATLLLSKGKSHYAITFGKAHFYVRPYCDYDFGIELAKRIADERDITQTAARRFQGKQKKDIRTFTDGSYLTVPPGSSVDFLQGRIITEKREAFGASAKFGASCLLTPDIAPSQIGDLLSKIDAELNRSPRFKLPRTVVLSDEAEIGRFDEKLAAELMSPIGTTDIATDTFDLFGVDFVFSSSGSFTLKCGRYKPVEVDRLTMREVKEYIAARKIPKAKVLKLRVIHHREGEPSFTQSIKEAVDYISDDDRVILRGGKWLQFNEDYLEALDAAIRRIEVEPTEADLVEISVDEDTFNKDLADRGYTVFDKDFQVLRPVNATTPVEAWDLEKGDTVYAVKFGTAQKLNYVVDQASNALELIHSRAYVGDLPKFERYCLWLGYRAKKRPTSLADSGSIILKQKVEAWARNCTDVGYTPVLKLSRKIHAEHDKSAPDAQPDTERAIQNGMYRPSKLQLK